MEYIQCIEDGNFDLEFFGDYDFMSDLWVAGSFDVVRFLYEKIKTSKKMPKDLIRDIESLKKEILRIRALITKFKSCGLNPKDLDKPWTGSSMEKGKFWQLNDKDTVYRNELSDSFLTTLDQFKDTPMSAVIRKKRPNQSLDTNGDSATASSP